MGEGSQAQPDEATRHEQQLVARQATVAENKHFEAEFADIREAVTEVLVSRMLPRCVCSCLCGGVFGRCVWLSARVGEGGTYDQFGER